MFFDFLYGMSACVNIQALLPLGKATLRHLLVLNVVKEGTKGFAAFHGSGATAMYDVVFMEFEDEPHRFSSMQLIRSPTTKTAVICFTHFYQSAVTLLDQQQKECVPHGNELVRTWAQFLGTELPHTKS